MSNDFAIVDFAANNTNDSFIFKEKIIGRTGSNDTKYVLIMVPLNYLSHFWRTLEISLVN